jgi:hypothetical protein
MKKSFNPSLFSCFYNSAQTAAEKTIKNDNSLYNCRKYGLNLLKRPPLILLPLDNL